MIAMAELIDEINEIIGENEQMAVDGEAAPQPDAPPQPDGDQNIEDPVEEILNAPRAPEPAGEFVIRINAAPAAAPPGRAAPPGPAAPGPAADVGDGVGAAGGLARGPRRQPQDGRGGGGRGRGGRGARGRHGNSFYRGTRAGRQVQRRREAAQFAEWLGLLQMQAYNRRR